MGNKDFFMGFYIHTVVTLIICNSIYLFIPGGNASGLLPQHVDQQISNGTFNRGTGLFLNTCAIICFLCQFIFDSLSRLSENKLQSKTESLIQSKIHPHRGCDQTRYCAKT